MKRFAKALLNFLIVTVVLFLILLGLDFLLQTNADAWNLASAVTALLSFLQPDMLLAFSCLCGFLAFLFTLLRKHPTLMTLLSVLFLVACTSWIVLQMPDLQASIQSASDESARRQAVEKAQENLIYEDALVYEYDGLPLIQVVSDEPKTDFWLNNVIQNAVMKMPQFLLDKCSTLIFMDDAHFQKEEMNESLSNVVGLANSADMSVKVLIQDFDTQYIDKSMPEWIMDPIDYYINTISHELGHIWDYQEAYSQVFLSDDPDFQELYETYRTQINDYASTNVHEFFAECAKLYYFYPEYLNQKSPEVYAYFDNLNTQYNS